MDGQLSDEDFNHVARAAENFEKLDIVIDDRGGLSTQQIRSWALMQHRISPLDLLVVDHMHIMREPGARSRVEELETISGGMKALAKELNIPVLLLAQLNRNVANRDNKRPSLADLRGSGSIEQDADVVLFCYREAYYLLQAEPTPDTPEHKDWADKLARCRNDLDVIAGKTRHRAGGTARLWADMGTNRIGNRSPHMEV